MNQSLPIYQDPQARRAFSSHERLWQNHQLVYPVVSRRSKGISVGINLNPDKICNFDCIYCCVERPEKLTPQRVDLARLEAELTAMFEVIRSGQLYQCDPFDKIPPPLQRLNDLAFSGDGEPTTAAEFLPAVELACRLKAAMPEVKLVLITNATQFHRPAVRSALALMDRNQGEIWAKLDAGTPEYYELVDRSRIPLSRVLENILWCARQRPTVIQSLFMSIRGEIPSESQIEAYTQRLGEIQAQGGTLKLIQLYTVARRTTESFAQALTESQLQAIARQVQAHLGDVAVEIYP